MAEVSSGGVLWLRPSMETAARFKPALGEPVDVAFVACLEEIAFPRRGAWPTAAKTFSRFCRLNLLGGFLHGALRLSGQMPVDHKYNPG